MPKRAFKFEINYFKPSGKWYLSAEFEVMCEVIGNDQPYYNDATDYIRNCQKVGKPLPGLIGGWSGYITLQYQDSYPTLIVPPNVTHTGE